MKTLPVLLAALALSPAAFAEEPPAAPAVSAKAVPGFRYDYDCVDVSFGAADPAASDYFTLRSQEWRTECVPVGDPRRGGGQNCYEVPGFSYSRIVKVERLNPIGKPMLPWERDVFRVCLQGPWLDSRPESTAYRYRLVDDGAAGRVAYEAQAKIPSRPDPAGLTTGALTQALVLTLNDRWASYYAGETLKVHVTLKRDSFLHPTVAEFDASLPTAAAYALDLAKLSGAKLSKGKGYFAKLSFQRLGKVSDDESVKLGDTAVVKYQPAALAVGR